MRVSGQDMEDLVIRFPNLSAGVDQGLTSMATVPLISKGQVFGTLTLRSSRDYVYTKNDLSLVERIGFQIAGILANAQLFAERKRTGQELEVAKDVAESSNRAKSEFLANMSHEIRTPLNAISGFAQLMMNDTEIPDKQRNYLDMVSQSSESLAQIVDDILDFSKIEAGKLDFESAEFDLRVLVDQTVAMFSFKAEEKGLKLESRVDDRVNHFLTGDPGRLGQILTNRMGNAIKFTQQGSVTLDVRVEDQPSTNTCLLFTISDTGVGIPEEHQQTIFDAFSQADSSTTRNYGGTGLGLAIASRLINQMGGRIWVESEVGVGSEFHFTVSLSESKGASSGTIDAEPQLAKHENLAPKNRELDRNGTLKILLAEDNELNQMLATEILEINGYKVVAARDGQRVLELLEEDSFDLILMDVHMPVLDGYETTRTIRKSETVTRLC
jgi:signal transduction histidine kinase